MTSRIPSDTPKRKRRRPRTAVQSILIFLSFAAIHHRNTVDAFGIRKWVSRRFKDPSSERFLADEKKDVCSSSWSKSASTRTGSPLQVRKRVKAVLDKARTRTGVDNSSTKASNIVAEAASLGGFDDDTIISAKLEEYTNGARNGSSFPDEDFVVLRSNGTETNNGSFRKPEDFDVIRGDIPAANEYREPLPFKLPNLSAKQIRLLESGERVQEQERMGREGSGYVVMDVKAPPHVIWESLLDFEKYPDMIPTVREMQLYTSEQLNTGYVNEKPVLPGTGRETRHYGTASVTRASFILSKFRLNIAAVHKYTPHPDGHYMIFTLDKSCTNMVLKGAKGIWHIIENPDGREGVSRVYLLCEVQISRALPSFIVDYAADRAMPRATTWLKPFVEKAAQKWPNSL